jgi:proline iminopeptidase
MRLVLLGRNPRLIAFTMLLVLSLPAHGQGEGTVRRADLTLHYRTVGTGASLLLLSGGPGLDVDYMMPLAQDLSGHYRCILLEQRGTGRSQPATSTGETINLKLLLEDIEALRSSLKLDRLYVLGHSFGGMLAMAYTAAHPDHVQALVLVASGGLDMSFQPVFLNNVMDRASMSERRKIQEALAAQGRAADSKDASSDVFHLLVPLYFFDRDIGERLIAQGSSAAYHPLTAQLLNVDLQRNYHVDEPLRRFSGPVLIVQGRQDPMPESVALQTQAVLKHSQLVFIDRSGHFPWLEQPQAFYESLHAFLKIDGQAGPGH